MVTLTSFSAHRAVVNRGRRGQCQVERIAEADAAAQKIEGGASAEASGDAQPTGIGVDVRLFKISELAVRRSISAHVVAAVLGENLLGEDAFERGVSAVRSRLRNAGSGEENQREQFSHARFVSL